MAAVIRIQIESTGGVADVKKDVASIGDAAKDAGKGFSALKEIGIGALRAIGTMGVDVAVKGFQAVAGAISDGIADAKLNAQIQAQTAAVLKSTGNAAGVSAEHIAEYASSLSDAAGASIFGDDQIQQSTNLLLTFTNLKGEVLDAATAISVDMAQAMGGAPKDAAIQLGKALNDPIAGVGALSRVGVTFDEQQKKLIKTYVEHGEMAKAQGIILGELNKEFGGSAKAAADATGGWSEFNGRMGEAKEALGAAILPLLNGLAGILNTSVLPIVETAAQAFGRWVAIFQEGGLLLLINQLAFELFGVKQAFTPISDALDTLAESWSVASEFTSSFAEQLGATIDLMTGADGTFQAVGIAIQSLTTTFSDAQNPIEGAINVLAQISPTVAIVKNVIQTALPIIKQIVEQVFGFIQAFIDKNGEDIKATVGEAWKTVKEIIDIATKLISGIVLALTIVVRDFLKAHGTEIGNILNNAWIIIKNVIMAALEIIKGLLKAALAIFQGDWKGAWEAIRTMSEGVVLRLWEIIKAGLDLIYNLFGTSLAKIKDKWNAVWASLEDAIQPIAGWFHDISDAISDVIGWIGRMYDKLKSIHIPDWLKGSSPPPLADWFNYISDATRGAAFEMVAFQGGLMAPESTTSSVTNAQTYSNPVTLNFQPRYAGVPRETMDLAMAKSLAGI